MREALSEARLCLRGTDNNSDDVPIGAVVVFEGRIIARAHNEVVLHSDATLHAELIAIRVALATLNRPRLDGSTLYVTLEPCPMCAGALWLSRIDRIVFGAHDAKAGACGSLFDIPRDPRLNHRPQLKGGILEAECAQLLSTFFQYRR
ncbi:nucleoside deaminase [bacterium]|nr:MAG: nucleoside deaminase [bacterium]